MSEAFLRLSTGHFDLCHPDEEQISVLAVAPSLPNGRLAFTVRADTDLSEDSCWSTILSRACQAHVDQTLWSSKRADAQALITPLAEGTCPAAEELDRAWAADALRKADDMRSQADALGDRARRLLAAYDAARAVHG